MKVQLIFTLLIPFNVFAEDFDANEYKGQYICFRSSIVEAKANYERVRWPGSQLTNVCSISFSIYSISPAHFYYTRGWRDPEYCKMFMKEWNDLRKKNKKVCIAADQNPPEKVKYKGKDILEQSAPWEIIRSGKWCRSYFVRDNCD